MEAAGARATTSAQGGRETRDGESRAVWAFVSLLALLASGLWLIGPTRHAYRTEGHVLPWLVLTALVVASEVLVFHFELRNQAHHVNLSEVPLVAGLSLASPFSLMAAVLTGMAGVTGVVKRQRPVKMIFNLASTAVGTAVAVLLYAAVRGSASPVSMPGWLAVVAATAVASAISHLNVVIVMALAGARDQKRFLASLAPGLAVSAVMNISVGLIAVTVLWVQPWGATLLLLVTVLIAAGYRAHMKLRDRHASLHLLYEFTRTLSGARQADEVATTMLRQAADLLRAEVAEVALPGPTGLTRMAVKNDRLQRIGTGHSHGLERAVLDGNRALLVPRTGRLGAVRDDLVARDLRDAMAAPLAGEDGPVGVLLVANRLGEVATFEAEDLKLLETLANHASIALRSGQLLDRLREEAAAKAHQARHDALTGLANRTLFAERVAEALASRAASDVAVMLMDLDAFKEVNDTLGHHTGDTLLRETAARLVRVVGERGTVARLGGDEFAMVLPGIQDAAAALTVAHELRAAVEMPLSIDELILETRASIGVALAPLHGLDPTTLLQRADVAMYSAKADRTGVDVYAAERDHYSPRRLALLSELRQAIERGELDVWYQPQADLATGRPIAVEALARWAHPKHGFVPPDEFIPLAEQSGLIRPLTLFVLRSALEQLARWRAESLTVDLAVNLSARSLLDPGLVDDIESLVRAAGVEPGALTLEITESTVMGDLGRSHDILARLSACGFHLSVDDFGTGYSSLSRLTRLPMNEVKIDKSFVFHMRSDPGDLAIVRSTIDLAGHLGLRVVAEGVEDRETWDELIGLGCDSAQGYFLSRPLPAAQIEQWLLEHVLTPVPSPSRHAVTPTASAAPRLRVVAGEAG